MGVQVPPPTRFSGFRVAFVSPGPDPGQTLLAGEPPRPPVRRHAILVLKVATGRRTLREHDELLAALRERTGAQPGKMAPCSTTAK